MAPLPENTTPTYIVDYFDGANEHSMQFRGAIGADPEDLLPTVQAFLNALGPTMNNAWVVTGARKRATGSNFTLPATPPTTPTNKAATGLSGAVRPRFVSFIGRGEQTGRRVRIFVYGLTASVPDDYRFQGIENVAFSNAHAVLTDGELPSIRTIAGDAPTWYDYQNAGYNSYWEREQRG